MKMLNRGEYKASIMYTCINPFGKKYLVEDLVLFCRAYRLSFSAMVNVANGREPNHKGWSCFHGEV